MKKRRRNPLGSQERKEAISAFHLAINHLTDPSPPYSVVSEGKINLPHLPDHIPEGNKSEDTAGDAMDWGRPRGHGVGRSGRGKVVPPDPARLDDYTTHAGQRRGHWPTSTEISAAMFEFYKH